MEVVDWRLYEIEGVCGADVWEERHRGGFGECVGSVCWERGRSILKEGLGRWMDGRY